MINNRCLAVLLSLFLCALAGCAQQPMRRSPLLPDGFDIKPIAKVDAGAPFAVNRAGAIVAMAEGSLRAFDPAGGPGLIIAPAPATDLSFSPDGERLAAAFATKERSLLRLFNLRGEILGEALLPGRVTAIAWYSGRELFATAQELGKDGGLIKASLYRWDGAAPPQVTPLREVIVTAQLAKLPEETALRSLSLALSPYGDEIAYSCLQDSKSFEPYLRVAVRHLATGAEREVTRISVGSGGLSYAPDGESLLAGDSHAITRRLSLPDGREMDAWPTPGDHQAVSPSGSYIFLDGRLYRDGREVTSFSGESLGAFLADGSGILASDNGSLILLSGLRDPKPAGPAKNLERLLELRRLHMLGKVSDTDYKARKAKLMAPGK